MINPQSSFYLLFVKWFFRDHIDIYNKKYTGSTIFEMCFCFVISRNHIISEFESEDSHLNLHEWKTLWRCTFKIPSAILLEFPIWLLVYKPTSRNLSDTLACWIFAQEQFRALKAFNRRLYNAVRYIINPAIKRTNEVLKICSFLSNILIEIVFV